MPELTVMESEVIDGPTLRELAATANSELDLAAQAAARTLTHVIRAGEALLAARRDTGPAWAEWVATNCPQHITVAWYSVRIAYYRDQLPDDVEGWTVSQARSALVGLPHVSGQAVRIAEDVEAEIRHLHDGGLTQQQIADLVGVSQGTVNVAVNPGMREQRNKARKLKRERARAARRALRESEREPAIRRALVKEGQAMNEVYATLNRLDTLLGQARAEAQDPDKRRAINEAHTLRDKMMDTIIRALGVS